MATCAICGKEYPERDLVLFQGARYCETCKETPAFQAVARGEAPAAAAPGAPQAAPTRWPIYLAIGCLGFCVLGGIGAYVIGSRVSSQVKGGLAEMWQEACHDQLREAGEALFAYRKKHGSFPPRLQDLPPAPGDDEPHFGCPGALMGNISGDEKAMQKVLRESYTGLGQFRSEGGGTPLLWDSKAENHGGRGRNVLFAGGAVRFVSEAEFQEMMQSAK